jgi:hypothetical protein
MPTLLLEPVVAILLLAWLLVSVLNQVRPRWIARLYPYDHLGLWPSWTFFDQYAGQSDYHLFYRDLHADGTVGGWRELPVTEGRTPYAILWNPGKRSQKVLSDLASSLVGLDARDTTRVIQSLPYQLLLNAVCQPGVARPQSRRQFMIGCSFGQHSAREPEILFRSAFHAVERR